jgi:release factor glutamine methyltransferase
MNQSKIKTIDGLKLYISPSVYEPAEDSFLLAEGAEIKENAKVLEVGSGSGYVTLYLAKRNSTAEFFCTDINHSASQTTLLNAKRNNVFVHVLTSNLLEAISTKPFFDIILFNSPYLPTKPDNSRISLAWSGGNNGLGIVSIFLQQIKNVLKIDGTCYLIVSSLTNIKQLHATLNQINLNYKVIDKIKEGRETILLYELLFNQ